MVLSHTQAVTEIRTKSRTRSTRITIALTASSVCLACAGAAAAQSAEMLTPKRETPRSAGLSTALSTTIYDASGLQPLGGVVGVEPLDAETAGFVPRDVTLPPGIAARLTTDQLAAEEDGRAARSAVERATRGTERELSMTYEVSIAAPAALTGLPLDVAFAPRASVERSSLGDSIRTGAEVRLGIDLDPKERDSVRPAWYLFAGSDNQMVTYDLNGQPMSMSELGYQEQITVGDMQAGVAFQQFGAQASFSWLQREQTGIRASDTNDYAAFTLTWKR
jgi:hypothetical protein